MVRATLCAAELLLSAGLLLAAEPQGKKADKSFPVTVVKLDAAKHLLVFKGPGPAGKVVETTLPVKDGVPMPNVPPGGKVMVTTDGGKVIAFQTIPPAPPTPKPPEKSVARAPDKKPPVAPPTAVKPPAVKQPGPPEKSVAKTPAKKPPVSPPTAVKPPADKFQAAKAAFDKATVAIQKAQTRLTAAKAFLAHVNQDKVMAQKIEKDTAAMYQTAATDLAKAKAEAAKAVKDRDEAIALAKAKAEAARVAQVKLAQAQQYTARTFEAKVLAAKLAKDEEAMAKFAEKGTAQVQADYNQAAKDKLAAEKKMKEVRH
jgi:hypothetical protein